MADFVRRGLSPPITPGGLCPPISGLCPPNSVLSPPRTFRLKLFSAIFWRTVRQLMADPIGSDRIRGGRSGGLVGGSAADLVRRL